MISPWARPSRPSVDLVADGRRHGRTHQIATVNVDFLVNALADEGVHRVLQNADICLADGAPIVWGAGQRTWLCANGSPGPTWCRPWQSSSASAGWRIHLFGSAPGTAERATELLIERYPGARITGDSGGFIKDVGQIDEVLLASLAAADADILCVALGNPKQERFIETYRARLGAPVMIGIGGTLDFIVGGRRRAPRLGAADRPQLVAVPAQEPVRLGKGDSPRRPGVLPSLARYLGDPESSRLRRVLRYEVSDTEVLVTIGDVTQVGGHWQWRWRRGVADTPRIDVGLGAADRGASSSARPGGHG